MSIDSSEATLLATVFGAFLYGLYTMVFFRTVRVFRDKGRKDGRWHVLLVLVSIPMYILASLYLVTSIIRLVSGFLGPDPETYFSRSQTPLYVLRDTALVVQTLIADGFLIYRLKLVWTQTRWVPLVLLVFWVGDLITGIGALVAVATVSPSVTVFYPPIKSWICSFFVMTLVTNGICTVLISLQLWRVHQQAAAYSDALPRVIHLRSIAIIILESGAIYSTIILTFLGTLVARSWSQYIILDMIPSTIGIVFSIIIIRLHLQLVNRPSPRSSHTTSLSPTRSINLSPFQRQKTGTESISMPQLAVRVDKVSTVTID